MLTNTPIRGRTHTFEPSNALSDSTPKLCSTLSMGKRRSLREGQTVVSKGEVHPRMTANRRVPCSGLEKRKKREGVQVNNTTRNHPPGMSVHQKETFRWQCQNVCHVAQCIVGKILLRRNSCCNISHRRRDVRLISLIRSVRSRKQGSSIALTTGSRR